MDQFIKEQEGKDKAAFYSKKPEDAWKMYHGKISAAMRPLPVDRSRGRLSQQTKKRDEFMELFEMKQTAFLDAIAQNSDALLDVHLHNPTCNILVDLTHAEPNAKISSNGKRSVEGVTFRHLSSTNNTFLQTNRT
ncbi:hypothetical protein HDU78_006037 [Chytriomyces hyalinus]|nr:hypothetical protein HDU78_006037 [Chytriomyces hyalinus]